MMCLRNGVALESQRCRFRICRPIFRSVDANNFRKGVCKILVAPHAAAYETHLSIRVWLDTVAGKNVLQEVDASAKTICPGVSKYECEKTVWMGYGVLKGNEATV